MYCILWISASCTAIQRKCVPVPSLEERGGFCVRKGIRLVKKKCQIPHMNHISEAARPGSNKLRTCRRMPRQNRDWALDRLGWGGCICGNRPTRAKHGLNGRKTKMMTMMMMMHALHSTSNHQACIANLFSENNKQAVHYK